MKTYRVIISKTALLSLKAIIAYIQKDSPNAALHVQKTLINIIRGLKISPEKFSKELLLDDKPGNYRSISKWHYKIIYRCTEKQVIVLDIIHTSRNPEILKKVV